MGLRHWLFSVTAATSFLSTSAQSKAVDSLPESNIDIPLQINLQAIAALVERNVDTLFTSPGYPDAWVQANCATRYKYKFRRSPLRMGMSGNTLTLGFTGYYQITGASRLCSGTTVLSPWSPSCTCGVKEPERRIDIGFRSVFTLKPNGQLQSTITRLDPVPRDKCEVCFFGKDVTDVILSSLKTELDLSRKAMQDSFGNLNLRPYLQQAWNKLNAAYAIPGIGYFSLHPKRLRMNNITAQGNTLTIAIGITAQPAVSFSKPASVASAVPDILQTPAAGGFSVYLDAALGYDSLSNLVNGYMAGKRFEVSDGLFKKHIIVKQVTIAANQTNRMLIKLDFTGSFNGTAFFTGDPVYNAATKTIEVQNMDYDLQTKNLLLKTAKWLFAGKIETELKKHTTINMADYFATAQKTLNNYFNKEWTAGIRGSGMVKELSVVSVQPLPDHILIKTACSGTLKVQVTSLALGL